MGKTKTAFVGEELPEKKDEIKKQKRDKQPEKVHISGLKGGQRIKIVGTEESQEQTDVTSEEKETKKKAAKIKVRGKKYQEAKAKVKAGEGYKIPEAIELVKKTSYSKFDGSVELHLILKKTGTSASLTLPHSAGKQKKVEIADDGTVEKLKESKIDFDILVATPDMMPKLVPFAKLLGPKGLMPNPKNGTLVPDPKKAKSFSAAKITLKTEKAAPLIHTVIGKVSQDEKQLEENFEAVVKALGVKQITKAYIKATMGPSVKISL